MNLIQKFLKSFQEFSKNIAFHANHEELTYSQFLSQVNTNRILLENEAGFKPQHAVGVLCNEMPETYSAILAIWFSGGIFLPLNPKVPLAVNHEIIQKHNLKLVISPGELPAGWNLKGVKILQNVSVINGNLLPLFNWDPDDTMYILQTSGSTGTPKSVPIKLKNVEAFTEGFLELYPELSETDNFLQTYELTADASFTGYLIPLLLGATVFTVPGGGFKPFNVAKIIAEKPITWVQVTPSLLACLRPFFHSFNLENIKHFHFGGEALPAEMTEEWRKHVPNAEISNVYGPTETTITATIYKCTPGKILKSKNNVVSIGKPLKKVKTFIQKDMGSGSGELLIAGDQVMENYLFTPSQPFRKVPGDENIYYPSGDYDETDEEGYLYYCGR
jgi:acyl-coenzyme A synthetase/AMP-(fatty) acid ligase